MTTDITELVQKAKLAEQTECHNDRTVAMEAVTEQQQEPSSDERDLLCHL